MRLTELVLQPRRARTAALALTATLWLGALAAPAGGSRSNRITISVSGDILPHATVLARGRALGGGHDYEFGPLFEPVRPWILGPDLAFCHLETPILARAPAAGEPPFNAPAALAEAIAATGWDACSTASNHSLDRGRAGIASTARALARAGIAATGSFGSARAARRPLILEARGIRVAFLAYTTNTNDRPLPRPHSVNILADPRRVIAAARDARRQGAHAVIVNVHWTAQPLLWTPALSAPGAVPLVPEFRSAPSEEQWLLVAALLRSRAITAVVGQGPHVVQPIVRAGDKVAVLSEGNLVSGVRLKALHAPGSDDGLIALLDIVREGARASLARVRYLPIFVDRPSHAVVPATPDSASYARTVGVAGRGPGVRPIRGGGAGSADASRGAQLREARREPRGL